MPKREAPVAAPQEHDQVDEHAGHGGSYVIENGKRRLVERTDSQPKPAAPADKE